MQLVQEKNPTCFICFGIGNLPNFAVVKSLRKFWGCLVDNNTFSLLKVGFKFFVFNSSEAAIEFFQINLMVGVVGFDKCNAIVIFSLKFRLKYFWQLA